MGYHGYRSYVDSGIPWIQKYPSHWNVIRLKWTIDHLKNGVWGAEPDGLNDIVVLRVADFDRTALRVSEDNLTVRSVEQSERNGRVLTFGDLLIEKSGGGERQLVGAVVQFDKEFQAVTSNFIASMKAAQGVSSRYLTYLHFHLYSIKVNYRSIKQTTGIQNLDSTLYFDEIVALPTLEEQEQITDFLEYKTAQIDALVGKKKEVIEKLKEQRIAIISQAVTKGLEPTASMRDSGVEWLGQVPEHWAIPALKMRYKVELGKMLDEKRITGDCLLQYLRNTDVQWDSINYEDLPQMDIAVEEYDRYTIRENDVLVCEGGEVGRAAVVTSPPTVIGFQKALHRLRPEKEDEVPRFLFYTLFWAANTGVFDVEGSSTISHLTGEQLRRYRFPQPPRLEQIAITAHLDGETEKIDRLINRVEIAINKLTEYRTALVTAATTGKIDVRKVRFGEAK